MSTTQQYSERLIAFIDILGFKDAVNNKLLEELVKCLTLFQQQSSHVPLVSGSGNIPVVLSGSIEGEDLEIVDRQISIFSDLVVISYPFNNSIGKSNLARIINTAYFIQEELVSVGYFARGAITIGNLYHKNNLCIGDALIEAYELEKKATYPRVVIDKKVIECESYSELSSFSYDLIDQDDEFHFISLFKPLKHFFDLAISFNDLDSQVKIRRIQVVFALHACQRLIKKGLQSADLRVKMKYDWLKHQYIESKNYMEQFYTFTEKEKKLIEL